MKQLIKYAMAACLGLASTAAYADVAPTSIKPASGSDIMLGDQVVITFIDNIMFDWDKQVTIQKEGSSSSTKANLDYATINGNFAPQSVYFTFNPEDAQVGDVYTCSIPAGTFWFEKDDKDTSEAFSLTYTVVDPSSIPLVPTGVVPSNNEQISDQGSALQININFDTKVYINPKYDVKLVNLITGAEYPCTLEAYSTPVNFVNVIYNNGNYFEGSQKKYWGDYELVIPAGVISNAPFENGEATGSTNSKLTYNWTLGEAEGNFLQPMSVEPADGSKVSKLDSFKMTFAKNVSIKEGSTAAISGGNVNIVAGLKAGENATEVVLDFDAITTEGMYTISVPEGVISMSSDIANSALSYNISVGEVKLEATMITPLPGKYAKFEQGEEVEVTFNMNDAITSAWFQIVADKELPQNEGSKVAYAMGTLVKDTESNTFKGSIWGDNGLPLYEDFEYSFVITALKGEGAEQETMGQCTIGGYIGTSEAPKVSAATLIGVTPNPYDGEISLADKELVLTFSAPVESVEVGMPLGMGGGIAWQTVTPNDDKTVWTANIEKCIQNAKGSLSLSVFAKDDQDSDVFAAEDLIQPIGVYGESIENMFGYITLSYMCFEGNNEIYVSPLEGEVESLYEFIFTSPVQESISIQYPKQEITLENAKGEVVAKIVMDDDQIGEMMGEIAGDPAIIGLTMHLDKKITEGGKYTLVIPTMTFQLSASQTEGGVNKRTVVEYTILSADVDYSLAPSTVTPAVGEVTEAIEKVDFEFDTELYLDPEKVEGYMSNRGGEMRTGKYSVNGKVLTFTPDEPIEDNGFYVLIIGKSTVGDKEWNDSGYTAGKANDNLDFSWTVNITTGLNEIDAAAISGPVYNIHGMIVVKDADAAALRNLDKGIYIVNGKKVVIR